MASSALASVAGSSELRQHASSIAKGIGEVGLYRKGGVEIFEGFGMALKIE